MDKLDIKFNSMEIDEVNNTDHKRTDDKYNNEPDVIEEYIHVHLNH